MTTRPINAGKFITLLLVGILPRHSRNQYSRSCEITVSTLPFIVLAPENFKIGYIHPCTLKMNGQVKLTENHFFSPKATSLFFLCILCTYWIHSGMEFLNFLQLLILHTSSINWPNNDGDTTSETARKWTAASHLICETIVFLVYAVIGPPAMYVSCMGSEQRALL